MKAVLAKRFPFVFSAGVVCILTASLYIVNSVQFTANPGVLSLGITLDIILVIPVLYYFFAVRKYKLPAITVLPVFVICTVIAAWVIPADNRQYLDIMKYGVALAEVSLLLLVVINIRRIRLQFKKHSGLGYDFIERLKLSIDKSIGNLKINNIIATEISVIYYSLFFWKAGIEYIVNEPHFSYHKKSGYILFMGVILAVLPVETFAMHALISRWSITAAYVMLALSAYALLFLMADMISMLKRPVILKGSRIFFRTGIRWRVDFPVREIEGIEKLNDKIPGVYDISPLGRPNVLIRLKKPVSINGLYGISKNVKSFSLFIDDLEGFENSLKLKF